MSEPSPTELFACLIEKRQAMYRIAARMVDDQAAEDLVQEAFASAVAGRHSFRGEAQMFSWVCGILMNHCRAELRRRRFKSVLSLQWLIEAGSSNQPQTDPKQSPERRAEQSERQALLRDSLKDLPEAQRAAVILVQLEGLSAKAAAEALQSTEAAVWKALSRARQTLRRVLNDKI